MSRKRLLLLTHRFPYPPNRGDRIRSYNLLRLLAESFDVTLACPHDEPITSGEMQHVEGLCESVMTERLNGTRWLRAFTSLARGASLTEGLFDIPALRRQVKQAQADRPYDVALVFCSSMYPYVREECFEGTPLTVDVVDVDSEKWRQMGAEGGGPKGWIYSLESRRVKQLEIEIGAAADIVTLVSESEAELFDEVASPRQPAIGVSNGVDTEFFDRGGKELPCAGPLRLVFTGVMDYPPNVEGVRWFCEQVLPRFARTNEVHFEIVGRNPSRKVLELNELPNVEVVGAVPDIRPRLHAASVAISPLHLARGIQNKVLEAMAAGLPVISTPQSATGIDGHGGEHFLIAETADEWCDALQTFASNPDYRVQVGKAARKLVVDRYAWNVRLAPVTTLLDPLANA
ncbi:MAG: TIGR03087 family PEP-CTERM/XrtA system glycosyltransferase [Planctomycetota bacterium]